MAWVVWFDFLPEHRVLYRDAALLAFQRWLWGDTCHVEEAPDPLPADVFVWRGDPPEVWAAGVLEDLAALDSQP